MCVSRACLLLLSSSVLLACAGVSSRSGSDSTSPNEQDATARADSRGSGGGPGGAGGFVGQGGGAGARDSGDSTATTNPDASGGADSATGDRPAPVGLGSPVLARSVIATQETADLIRILAAGQYETTFMKSRGYGASLYDLKNDPGKKLDLSPSLKSGIEGLFWNKFGPEPNPTGISFAPSRPEEWNLIEPGPARVSVRIKGLQRKDPTKPRFGYDQIFTYYPDGSVYISYKLELEQPFPFSNLHMILTTTQNWKAEMKCATENGFVPPGRSAFILAASNGPTYFTDILMASYKGKHGRSYWEEGFSNLDWRCGTTINSLWPGNVIPAGDSFFFVLQRFGDNMNTAAQAAVYSNAYRTPDKELLTTVGSVDKGDAGDLDKDGFNEAEGCYVLRATKDGLKFTIHSKQVPRPAPVFKVKDWPGAAPTKIQLGDKQLTIDKDYVAANQAGVLIIQLQSLLSDDVVMTLSP